MNKEQTRFNFDSNPIFETIDYEVAARSFIPGYESIFNMALALLSFSVSEQSHLLIVAAGGGMELTTFGKAQPHWQMTGVDPSAKMLAITQEKVAIHGLKNRVKLHQGLTHELPLTPLYDAATCILAMHFLPDDGAKLSLLQSISQRLKIGAKFILVDICEEKSSESFNDFLLAYKYHARHLGLSPEIVEEAATNVVHINCISEERTIELLQEANFSKVTRFFTALWFRGWIATKNT
ncbi:class I SAM-dependent methyltransferase [Scytonema tolypothrichoides VB-61278]|nr:class I SAM-dependent methyltransferase [Scytonema tolypothrichoides VB-61278]